MKFFLTILVLLESSFLWGQTLLYGEQSKSKSILQTSLSGFLKGDLYLGKITGRERKEMKSIYSIASVQIQSKFGTSGQAFADIRFRKGYELGSNLNDFFLREGYISIYEGPLEFSLGQKIISWGKADGFNPTNNVTPVNEILRSPDPEDRKMSNFLLQGKCRLGTFGSLEALWIPKYRASLLPWTLSPLPEGVLFEEGPYPDPNLHNSAWALKLNLVLPRFDASVSWFSGFAPEPGLYLTPPVVLPDQTVLTIVQTKAYHEQVVGFDFSSRLGKTGLRGEIAWRGPESNYQNKMYVPNPDIWYVLGLDRSLGNFQIIFQYMGRFVFNFRELIFPSDTNLIPLYQMNQTNRMFKRQQHEWSHLISVRPSFQFLHENLKTEIFGMYNFTTEEYLIIPKLTYSLTDGLELSAGLEYYSGKEQTLFNLVENEYNSVFLQLKATF